MYREEDDTIATMQLVVLYQEVYDHVILYNTIITNRYMHKYKYKYKFIGNNDLGHNIDSTLVYYALNDSTSIDGEKYTSQSKYQEN
jgi:hypothetical protein